MLNIPGIYQNGSTGKHQELTAIRRDGSEFEAELTVSRIDHSPQYIVVIRDVSQRKELQAKILDIASDEQRAAWSGTNTTERSKNSLACRSLQVRSKTTSCANCNQADKTQKLESRDEFLTLN